MIRRMAMVVVLALTVAGPAGAQSPSVSPSASPPEVSFADGTHLVGGDVPPGTYMSDGGDACYWARLAGFGGTNEEIIANDNATGQVIVTIEPTDVGFLSEGCGTWTLLTTLASPLPSTSPTLAPGFHGQDLAFDELSMPGTLGFSLREFVRRWNRQTDDPPFRIRRQPRVTTNENGVQTFVVDFDRRGGFFSLVGAIEDRQVSRVMLVRTHDVTRAVDVLDELEALSVFQAFVDVFHPGVDDDFTVASVSLPSDDDELPGEPPDDDDSGCAPTENRVTVDNVTFTYVCYANADNADLEHEILVAREADPA